MIIAPSILAADFTRLGEHVREAEQGGGDQIHIDVMDGRFVPNITMGPMVVAAVRRVTGLPLDVHLMIVEPEKHLDAFASAGATTLTVHIEASPNLHRTLQHIRGLGCKAGVALNPHTPAALLENVWDMLDLVLVMTVNPGFGGQRFLPGMLPKIRQAREHIEQHRLNIDVSVDGGIDVETAPQVVEAGANVVVAGSAVFGAEAPVAQAVASLRKAAAQVMPTQPV